MRLAKLSSDIETRKLFVDNLDDLLKRGLREADIDWAINIFRQNDDRQKAEVAIYFIDAYKILGSEAIINVRYLKTPIMALLEKHKRDKNHNAMFSQMVRDAIKKQIPENNEYLLTDVIVRMKQVFLSHFIDVGVEYPTIQTIMALNYKGRTRKEG